MPRTPNPQQMAQNFQKGIAGAGAKWAAGIAAVTANPAQAALAKVNDGTWAANTMAAQSKMAAGLSAVTLQSWQQAAQNGQAMYTSSANKAQAKYAAKAQALATAAAAASAAAHGATGATAKWQAAVNAMRSAFGKGPVS